MMLMFVIVTMIVREASRRVVSIQSLIMALAHGLMDPWGHGTMGLMDSWAH